jgi:hypothetical protein
MSAMGDRLLILEDAADALDVIDPELAKQFRLANCLPFVDLESVVGPGGADPSWLEPGPHTASIEEIDQGFRASCSCGAWAAEVGWDEIDDLVMAARAHFGALTGPVLVEAADHEGADLDLRAVYRRSS